MGLGGSDFAGVSLARAPAKQTRPAQSFSLRRALSDTSSPFGDSFLCESVFRSRAFGHHDPGLETAASNGVVDVVALGACYLNDLLDGQFLIGGFCVHRPLHSP
jgi:hypothetical protein